MIAILLLLGVALRLLYLATRASRSGNTPRATSVCLCDGCLGVAIPMVVAPLSWMIAFLVTRDQPPPINLRYSFGL
jgi:hypothetical protein